MNRNSAESHRPERLTDSYWFWLALFGFMAVVALLTVQGKFAQRQARLEQRYQDRLLAQEARTKMARAPENSDAPIERGYEDETEVPIAVSMAEARATTSLVPLMFVAAGIMLVGIAGLMWSRRASQAVQTPGTDLPSSVESARDRAESEHRQI